MDTNQHLLMANRLILTPGGFVSKSTILEGVESRASRVESRGTNDE